MRRRVGQNQRQANDVAGVRGMMPHLVRNRLLESSRAHCDTHLRIMCTARIPRTDSACPLVFVNIRHWPEDAEFPLHLTMANGSESRRTTKKDAEEMHVPGVESR